VIAEIGAPLTIVILLVGAAGLVAFGFTSGRFIALAMLGAAMTAALVISDVSYFGFGVNLIGYCGEPKCDPGPIPAVIAVPFLIPSVLRGYRRSCSPRMAQAGDPGITSDPSISITSIDRVFELLFEYVKAWSRARAVATAIRRTRVPGAPPRHAHHGSSVALDGDDRLRGARRIRGRDARAWRVGGHDRGAGTGRKGAAGVGGGTGREVTGGLGEGRAECDERERGCGEELGGGDGVFLVVRSRRWDGRFGGLWERRR
jgi:hypothetical protein